jgi:hypothetical protein
MYLLFDVESIWFHMGSKAGFGVDYSPCLKSPWPAVRSLIRYCIVDSDGGRGLHNLHGHPSPCRSASAGINSCRCLKAHCSLFSEKLDTVVREQRVAFGTSDTAVHLSSEALTNGISWLSPKRSVSIEQARAQSGRSISVGIPMHSRNQRT